MNLSFKLLLLAIIPCFSFHLAYAQQTVVSINGSSNFNTLLLGPHKDEIEKKANVTLKIEVKRSEYGLKDLALGQCDIAMLSGTLQSLAQNLNEFIPNLIQLDQYTESILGESSVVFIVNKKNPLDYLSSEQLRRICIGDILNWKIVGGNDARIIFFTMEHGDGVRTVIQDELLHGDFFGVFTTLVRIDSINEMVAIIPDAIGMNNIFRVDDSVKILKTDISLTQPLIVVTKLNPSPEVTTVINLLKDLAKEKFSKSKNNQLFNHGTKN